MASINEGELKCGVSDVGKIAPMCPAYMPFPSDYLDIGRSIASYTSSANNDKTSHRLEYRAKSNLVKPSIELFDRAKMSWEAAENHFEHRFARNTLGIINSGASSQEICSRSC